MPPASGPLTGLRIVELASEIAPWAGNARENLVDGALLPTQAYQQGFASFAQPSGLASDGERLFVADSEGIAAQSLSLKFPCPSFRQI